MASSTPFRHSALAQATGAGNATTPAQDLARNPWRGR